MTPTPVNSELEVSFLYEQSKDAGKEPPVYITVESDGDAGEPSKVNMGEIDEVDEKPPLIKIEKPDDFDDFVMYENENIKEEQIVKSEEMSDTDADLSDENVSDDDDDASDNNVDESLGYKYPYVYLRQYCTKCKILVTRHKSKTLRSCLKCTSPLLYECVVCKRKYKRSSNIYSHLKTKFDCRQKPDLHCSHCDYTNIHKGFMKNHIAKKHSGGVDDLVSCSKCGRHFKRAYNAEEHELSCGAQPYLECTFCDFQTTYRISFKVHKNQHIVAPENGAALVNEKFEEVCVDPLDDNQLVWTPGTSKADRLRIRKKTNSKEAAAKKVKIIDLFCRNAIKMYCFKCKESRVVRSKKPDKCQKCRTELLHECGLCASKFTTYENILRHFRDRHGQDDIKDTYVCSICDRRYDGFKKLMRHETFCSRTLHCGLCPFTAKMPNVLRRHAQKWHFGPDKNQHQPCLKCGRQKRSFKGMACSDYCGNCA